MAAQEGTAAGYATGAAGLLGVGFDPGGLEMVAGHAGPAWRRVVVEGPFDAVGELVAGFWLWEVRDMEEAVAWLRRCPNPMPGGAS